MVQNSYKFNITIIFLSVLFALLTQDILHVSISLFSNMLLIYDVLLSVPLFYIIILLWFIV